MFANNIPSDADADQMLAEGKKMGLSPDDLAGGKDSDDETPSKPNPFDLTGQSSPGSDEEQKPVEKKQPEKKSEADEEDEDEQPEKKPDEKKKDEKSDEDEDDDEKSPESNKSITRGEFGKFTRGLKKEFAALADSLKTLAATKTPEKKDEAAEKIADQVDEIKAYAEKYKDENGKPLDAGALKDLYGVFEKMMMSKIPLDQLNKLKDVTPVIDTMSQSIKKDEAKNEFNNNWDDFQPTLAKQYPNATPEQWKKAKSLLRELATSEAYGNVEGKHVAYPLAHIVAIESEKIKDALFSPKRKTAETGQLGEGGNDGAGDDLTGMRYEDMTPKKAAALTDMLNDDQEYS